jgi:hypothetical protein
MSVPHLAEAPAGAPLGAPADRGLLTAVREALATVEDIESVVQSLPEGDQRRVTLCRAIDRTLKATAPVRPVIAADVLGLHRATVR